MADPEIQIAVVSSLHLSLIAAMLNVTVGFRRRFRLQRRWCIVRSTKHWVTQRELMQYEGKPRRSSRPSSATSIVTAEDTMLTRKAHTVRP